LLYVLYTVAFISFIIVISFCSQYCSSYWLFLFTALGLA